MVGQTLGHYRILDKLGAGGMGEVYRAKDTTLDREVALKILPPELAESKERLDRFQREAKTLAALDHPNIVTVFTVEQAEDVHFLTMQLVEGKPLSQLIPKGGMPLERIFEIAIPLADALATAHEKGVIHRDFKPANIMVTDEGRVKVLDFGLAKLMQEAKVPLATELPTEPLTKEGTIVGTMPYMSPEQLEGQEVDARSDIFSLGVMLYEMASGQRPFSGDTSVSLISSIVKDTPVAVDTLREGLPHHLARVITHCLEKSPKRRYQSAIDIRNELDALKKEIESGVEQPSSAEQEVVAASLGRRWWPLMAAGAILLVALVAFWFGRRQPHPAQVAKSPAQPPMIVVLPFENLGDPADEYFADGMTEEITSRLAVVSGLRVISRTSAMQYKEDRPSLKQVGEELGVDYVLEGTVRWAKTEDGSRVRITPQLIQVADDTHLWADAYDRVMDDIFEIQSDIASEVIRALGVTLQGSEPSVLEEHPTDSIEAYQAYLHGIDLAHKYRTEDSVRMFEKAVELDPTFAEAWARLGRGKAYRYFYSRGSDLLPEVENALDKAKNLAPDNLEVRLAQAFYFYYGLRDFSRALEEFEAIAKDFPNTSEVLQGKAYILRRQGRLQASTEVLLDSLSIDPKNAFILREVASTYRGQRLFEEALSYLDRAIALEPDNADLYEQKSEVLVSQGSIEAARKVLASAPVTEPMHRAWLIVDYFDREWSDYLERAQRLPRNEPLDRALSDYIQGEALFQLNRQEEARESWLSSAEALEEQLDEGAEWVTNLTLALTYSGLGRKEEALAQLQRVSDVLADDHWMGPLNVDESLAWVYAVAKEVEAAVALWDRLLATDYANPLTVHHLRLDAFLDPIRDDPRFQALLEKYGQEAGP